MARPKSSHPLAEAAAAFALAQTYRNPSKRRRREIEHLLRQYLDGEQGGKVAVDAPALYSVLAYAVQLLPGGDDAMRPHGERCMYCGLKRDGTPDADPPPVDKRTG